MVKEKAGLDTGTSAVNKGGEGKWVCDLKLLEHKYCRFIQSVTKY